MRKLSIAMIVLLFALLLPYRAAQAAGQEEVVLSTVDGKAVVDIVLPDAGDGVTTLKLSIKITGETEKTDSENPLRFDAEEGIGGTLTETRYQAEKDLFTIYLSDTSEITDKTSFRLGYLVPNSVDNTAYSLELSVPENGLSYVDGTGVLKADAVLPSPTVELRVNQMEEIPEETPEETPEDTPEDTPEEVPGETSDISDSGQNTQTDRNDLSGKNTEEEAVTGQKALETGDDTKILLYIVLLGGTIAGTAALLRSRYRRN